MMSSDYMVRATAMGGRVRAFSMVGTGVTDELRRRHDTYPAVTAALGRTAMGALLLAAASLKEADQLLTVEVRGDGPAGRIIASANGSGGVRGLVATPHVHADSIVGGKLNVAGVVGSSGYISVTRDLGMKEPYSGTVALRSGEIGDDLAFYLARSEQTPSAVGVGVFVVPEGFVSAAGGFLVQLLPGLDESEMETVESRIAGLPHPTRLIRDGLAPEEILASIFDGDVELLDRYPVRFECPCSKERFQAAIVTLGSDEISRIIAEETDDRTEVVCHFCNEAYYFTADDMQDILAEAL